MAEILQIQIDSQQLSLIAGRIENYQEDAQGVNVFIRPRARNELILLRVGIVINCTGTECDYRQLRYPLILNLLKSGLVRPDPLHLGLDVTVDGAIVDNLGQASQQLYTLGPPQKGTLWETTAVPEIRQQAQTLATILLKY